MTVEAYAAQTADSLAQGPGAAGARGRSASAGSRRPPSSPSTRPAATPACRSASCRSLQPRPQLRWDDDAEALREQIAGTVSALLGLVGIEADPVRSREHILLSNIFEHAWRAGPGPGPGQADPGRSRSRPCGKLGVFDVDTFYPAEGPLRSWPWRSTTSSPRPPSQTWIQGEPLDIGSLLYGAGRASRASASSTSPT